VDFVGDCRNLSQFADGSVEQVYASHVYEHLPYSGGVLLSALREVHRVLRPGGIFRVSVPDLEICCRLFLAPQATAQDRFMVMRFIFGGQLDAHDFHQVGLTFEFFGKFLQDVGFGSIQRVEEFKLFEDTSSYRFHGVLISLNVEAIK
jgi:predicted SAM-dependent methyltransferase